MKRAFFLLFTTVTFLSVSCNQNGHQHKPPKNDTCTPPPNAQLFTQPIPVDTADSMIQCYLNSIHYPSNDTNVTSFIVNADTLRNYLNDTSNGKIVQVKLMLAHTLNCVHSPAADANCGYNNKALTIVIVGYDKNNNYVLNPQGMVYDRAQTCPPYCPSSGTASNALIQ